MFKMSTIILGAVALIAIILSITALVAAHKKRPKGDTGAAGVCPPCQKDINNNATMIKTLNTKIDNLQSKKKANTFCKQFVEPGYKNPAGRHTFLCRVYNDDGDQQSSWAWYESKNQGAPGPNP